MADPVAPMLDPASEKNFIDGYSTLYAIRSPTTGPGYDGGPVSIQKLFDELLLAEPVRIDEGRVFLPTGPGILKLPLVPAVMPDF